MKYLALIGLVAAIWLIVAPKQPPAVAPPTQPIPKAQPVRPRTVPQTKDGVPAFAQVLGIRLGMDTEEQLERNIGKGAECVGGHSNSGREWFFDNGLTLRGDGFDYGRGGLYLDTLNFEGWAGRLGDTPGITRYSFGVWKNLRVGMTPEECLHVLPDYMASPIVTTEEMTWKANVKGKRNGQRVTLEYDATLHFANGTLDYLLLGGNVIDP